MHIARAKVDGDNVLRRFDVVAPGEPFTAWFNTGSALNGYYPTRPFRDGFRGVCIDTAKAICGKLAEKYGDGLGSWRIAVVNDLDQLEWDSTQEYESARGVVVFLPTRSRRRSRV